MTERLDITGVLDHLDDKAEGDKLSIGEVLDSLGSRGFGPLLLAVALIELLPTGAIPGVPTLVSLLVILISGQLLFGNHRPWVPAKLRKISFDREKFQRGRDKVKPWTRKIDRAIKPRMPALTSALAARLVAVLCIILAITMPPLEVVPFASSIPSAAIGLLGLGLSARDGLLIALGLLLGVGGVITAIVWLI